jgi:hypothetical protein
VLRCAVLNRVIGAVAIDTICSPAVRNAWEHLDQRLDAFWDNPKAKSYSHFGIRLRPEEPDHVDFKSFDPFALSLRFADDVIHLKPCWHEIRALNAAVIAAHDSLNDMRVVPWAPN